MPQAIKPNVVTTETITREGEVTIRLVIELNLNMNGQLTGVVASTEEKPVALAQKSKDEAEWMVPEFSPSTETIEFGKYEK